MKNIYVIGLSAIIISGFIFGYFEFKKQQNILNTILMSLRELKLNNPKQELHNVSIVHPPPQPIPFKESKLTSSPIEMNQAHILNENENENENENLINEINKYKEEIEKIDEILENSDLDDVSQSSSNISEINIEELSKKVNNNMDTTEIKHNEIIEHLESNDVEEYDHTSISLESEKLNQEDIESQSVSIDSIISNNSNMNMNIQLDDHSALVDIYYNKYTNKELKNICKENNISISGNKTSLIERLLTNNILENNSNNENINVSIN